MDTRQLKTLVAIADYGTFARAAEVVHLTPSAVSQQIHALEDEVGMPLFNRERRPPTLNIQGLQLLETAKQVLGLIDDANSVIQGRRTTGTLNIGSVRTSTIGLLPRAIVALRSTYPELRVKVRVGLSSALISDVRAGRIDLAIVAEHLSIPRTLSWAPFIREPLVVIAPPGTPDRPAKDMLEQMPFVRFSSNVPLANLIDTELARMNVTTNDIAEIDTIPAIVECVAAGLGVSVVPRLSVSDSDEPLTTSRFGSPQLFRQIGIVQQGTSAKLDLLRDMHNTMAEMAGEYGVTREQ